MFGLVLVLFGSVQSGLLASVFVWLCLFVWSAGWKWWVWCGMGKVEGVGYTW